MAPKTTTRTKGKKLSAPKRKSPANRKKSVGKTKKRQPWNHLHCIFFLAGLGFALTVFISFSLYLFILLDIPNLKSIRDYEPKMTTRILAENNRIVKEIFEENRRVITLEMMPELLPRAFVAAEDSGFYEHPGVDFWSILRAMFHNFRSGSRSQGGSTITQQVTRSLLLSRKKVYSRKIKEAILAYRIDSVLSKDEILYIYLNQIYLGEGAYGVEAAARAYFNKTAEKLSLAQIALLAGLPQAPSRYSPFKDIDLAKKRQAYVLNRMAEEGYITPEVARKAFRASLELRSRPDDFPGSEYYVQQVNNYISSKYGREVLAAGGLTVYTCLDPAIQRQAVRAIREGIAKITKDRQNDKSPQAAMVVMESDTGRVRAVVGGTDFYTSQFDRAVQARRQPGSAFKPVVYATALENGFRPDSILIDEPLSLAGASRGRIWRPQNFENRHYGPTSLREGLVYSRNIIAIKLLQEVGIKKVIAMAGKLGIHSPIKPDLTLALGSSGISLLEMTGAYSVFANHGYYAEPIFIEKIIDRHGRVLEENSPRLTRVMSEKTAGQIDEMLQEVIIRGTGVKARGLQKAAAGKTGTTDQNMDAWFIGYSGNFLAGVWVGHDKKISLGEKASGGQVAAPIWLDFMKHMEEGGN